MQNRRSNSVAVPERGRFMPPGHIALFGVLLLAVLLAVFPGERLQRRLESSAFSDPLSMAYLAAWLRAQPEAGQLRLALAQRQLAESELSSALLTLQPLLLPASRPGQPPAPEAPGPHWREAELLRLDILGRQVWRHAPGSAGFAAARQVLLAEMQRVGAQPWPPAQLERFTRSAIALEAPVLAEYFLQRHLLAEPEERLRLRQELARLQAAQGHYREAAASYFSALQASRSLAEKRRLYMAGLSVLQSGNLLDEAMTEAVNRGQDLENDPATLEFLARLALAANRLDLAQHYAARLLQQRVQLPAPASSATGSGVRS